jgi:lipopolysaccharide export system permease protein
MAGTYLGRLTGLLADHVPPGLVGQLFMLYLPAIMVKTFTMAVLLAALLGFGRLSSDSEIVALRAAGASIVRIVVPVAAFSVVIALVTFWFDEQVVPSASAKSNELLNEIRASLSANTNQPIARTVVQNKRLRLSITARNLNPSTESLEGVVALIYNEQEQLSYILQAKELTYEGLLKGRDLARQGLGQWRIRGGFTLTDAKFTNVMHGVDAWPSGLPTIGQNFTDLTAERNDQFDQFSMRQLRQIIALHDKQGDWKDAEIANAWFGYWNKIALPLAAIVFGPLGAVLGVRNHRTGTATGFALAVAIIFAYFTLANFMNVWALGGVIPPYTASFAPLVLGLVATGIIMWRRNA